MLIVHSDQMRALFLNRVTDIVTDTLRGAFAAMPDPPPVIRKDIQALVGRVYPGVATYDVPTERFVAKFCVAAAFLGEGFDRRDPALNADLKRTDLSRYEKEDRLERHLAAALAAASDGKA